MGHQTGVVPTALRRRRGDLRGVGADRPVSLARLVRRRGDTRRLRGRRGVVVGVLAGLILAEIELEDINQKFEFPEWIGIELTGLKNWSNASLATTLLNAEELKKTLQQR